MCKCFICGNEILQNEEAVIMNGPDKVRVVCHKKHNGCVYEKVIEK